MPCPSLDPLLSLQFLPVDCAGQAAAQVLASEPDARVCQNRESGGAWQVPVLKPKVVGMPYASAHSRSSSGHGQPEALGYGMCHA